VNILDGIKNKLGKNVVVSYAPGCGRRSREWVTIPSTNLFTTANNKNENGLLGEYFNNTQLTGEPCGYKG
jgi:beta-glucosidase